MKAKDLKTKAPNICIWGNVDSGKTALVAQAAGGYIIDTDDGMWTIKSLKDKFFELRQQVEFDTFIDVFPNPPKAFLNIKRKLLEISRLQAENKWPFDFFALDSLTGLAKAVRYHIMGTVPPDKHSETDVFAVPQLKHYNFMTTAMDSLLAIMRSFKTPVILTAHETIIETDDSIMIKIKSVTKPHGMNEIPWQFDEIWHAKKKPAGGNDFNYVVGPSPSVAISTRSRSGFKEIVHNEIGLAGVLAKIGYIYEPK